MNKTFIFKKTHTNNESIKLNLISEVNQHIGALSIGCEDFQVEIKPYSKRSTNALAAYWCLIKAIVKWDKDNNGYDDKVWDEWFKREAGLLEDVYMFNFVKYKVAPRILLLHEQFSGNHGVGITFISIDKETANRLNLKEGDTVYDEPLNFQYVRDDVWVTKTRSLSNKGDITKDEMQRLLMTVMEFGKDNGVPDCFIPDDELTRLLKFSRGFRDG